MLLLCVVFAHTQSDQHQSDTVGHPPPCWPTLTCLCVRFNSIADMDASLQLLPKLEVLSMTDNALVRVDNLQHCTSLTRLVRG